MNQYLKIILKTGGELLFPLAFWRVSEVENAIDPANVADCVLVGGAS